MPYIYLKYSKVWYWSSWGRKKVDIFSEKTYLSTPVFGHSTWGELVVELFKFLNITRVLALVGASLINFHPTFKTQYHD